MIELGRLESILEELAPVELSDPYDRPCYLWQPKDKLEKIGVCVDPTEYNIRTAGGKGVELLLTHHQWVGEAEVEIREKKIGIYQMHSVWNRAPDGIIATLARLLNLDNAVFEADAVLGETDMTLKELLGCCQRILEFNIIPYFGELSARIKKVALISGPGFLPLYKEEWDKWIERGCDAILSSETGRYAVGYLAKRNIKLIDLGHSLMARPGMKHLAYILKNRLKIFECEVEFFPDVYNVNYHIGSFYPGLETPDFFIDKEVTEE